MTNKIYRFKLINLIGVQFLINNDTKCGIRISNDREQQYIQAVSFNIAQDERKKTGETCKL